MKAVSYCFAFVCSREFIFFRIDRRLILSRFTRESQSFIARCMIHLPGICQVALLVHCIVISADRSFSGTCFVVTRGPVPSRQRRDNPPSALLISTALSMVMASVLSLMKQSWRAIEIGAADKIRRPYLYLWREANEFVTS